MDAAADPGICGQVDVAVDGIDAAADLRAVDAHLAVDVFEPAADA